MKIMDSRESAENTNIKLYSESQASSFIGISKTTLQRKRKEGEISFYRVGGRVLYSLNHVEEFLLKCEKKANV